MTTRSTSRTKRPTAMLRSSRRITIGYVPLTDCAPLIVAHDHGHFTRHGLDVRLSREAGWASVREKMLHGELDAAHAPASMVIEMSHGLGVAAVPSLTGIVLAHHGNTIVLSNELRRMGVTDAPSLGDIVRRLQGKRRFTFAGVLKYSSQHYLMRRWLRSGGIDPDRDVNIAIVPPPLVGECLEQGHLDGFCVAEPWGSVCIQHGIAWCATLSADFDPMHPEKVFMVRQDFELDRHDEHLRLIAALADAAQWCDQPENRPALAELLSSPGYLDAPASALRNSLIGPYQNGCCQTFDAADAIIFHRNDASRPGIDKAAWVIQEIRSHGLGEQLPQMTPAKIRALYREDLYEEALALLTDST